VACWVMVSLQENIRRTWLAAVNRPSSRSYSEPLYERRSLKSYLRGLAGVEHCHLTRSDRKVGEDPDLAYLGTAVSWKSTFCQVRPRFIQSDATLLSA
jgi:hypothetical protein